MDVCWVQFVVCLYIYVCERLLQINIAGVPSSRATSWFRSTTPPPVRVSAVLGTLVVWIPNPKKKNVS